MNHTEYLLIVNLVISLRAGHRLGVVAYRVLEAIVLL
jgi:hypothetical protein